MMTRELKLEGYSDGKEYVNGSQQRVFFNVDFTGRGEQYRDDEDDETSGSGLDSY